MIGTVARVLARLLLVVSCTSVEALSPAPDPPRGTDVERIGDWSAVWDERGGLSLFSWIDGDRFVVNTTDGERDFVAGVNLGVTVPGHFPGELAVAPETYRRWLSQIASVGFTASASTRCSSPTSTTSSSGTTRPTRVIPCTWSRGSGHPR